jgi:hypothetical protein
MEPVDLSTFVKTKQVMDIIENSSEKVSLTTDSEGTAGNSKITGLNQNRYYVIEDYDEDGNFIDSQFVRSNGGRSVFTNIGRVSGREVIGLRNDHEYKLRSAVSLPATSSMTYYDISTPPPGGGTPLTATVTNGVITIPKPPDNTYYLDVTPYTTGYSIVKVNAANTASAVTPSGSNYIALETTASTVDYVFAENFNQNNPFTGNFYVLRVTIQPLNVLKVTISYSSPTDQKPTITGNSVTYSQNSTSTITITVSNASIYEANNFKWYIRGTQQVTTSSTLSLDLSDNTNIDYKVVGTYYITVEAVKKDSDNTEIPYSTVIEVTVTGGP